ncbi:MAG TPA: GntG family PLP-dependent aldolase [Terriglobales bacterium]
MRGRFTPKGLNEVEEMQGRGVASAVDLRSDSVTRPTVEMRRALMAAEVGDDAYGDDPTVNRLQARAAELLGQEAALFVPSGTMANQIAAHLHTRPGQEIVCEARAHIYTMEGAMTAVLSGCQFRPVEVASGRLTWGAAEPALRLEGTLIAPERQPTTGLVVAENTHAAASGAVTTVAMGADLCRRMRALGVPVHLDGARLFNAATALGVEVRALAEGFDSVMVCLAKGLGAPAGAVLAGRGAWIRRARGVRQRLGGGMNQTGVLAAAGLVALEKGPERLTEDHALARRLAEGAVMIAGVRCDLDAVATNIVIVDVTQTEFTAQHVAAKLLERNVLVHALDVGRLRLVTHRDLDTARCDEALFALRAVIERE